MKKNKDKIKTGQKNYNEIMKDTFLYSVPITYAWVSANFIL